MDRRGVSEVIGAIFLFAIVIIAFSTYQAFIVPQQNAGVESEHLDTIDQQMQDLRNTVVSLPGTASDRSLTFRLGTTYRSRIVAVNPPDPSGTFRTAGTGNASVNVTLANAVATDGETADFWDGTNQSRNDGGVVYVPGYNEFENPPRIVYENSLLFKEFESGNVSETGQRLVDGQRLTVVALNGSFNRGSSETISVDLRAVSAASTSIEVTNETGENVSITVTTRRNASSWREVLADDDQFVDDGGHVVRVTRVGSVDDTYDRVTIVLEQGVTYDLQMAKAGLGSRVTDEEEAYLTDISGTLREDETSELTVTVRDRFNNPVSGVTVEASADQGTVESDETTASDGHATFDYTAPSGLSADEDVPVNFSYQVDPAGVSTFDESAPENVSMTVRVQGSTSGGSTNKSYTLQWNRTAIETESGVSACHDGNDTCVYDEQDDTDAPGFLDLTAETTDPAFSFAFVDFSTNDSSVVTNFDPSENETDSTGVVVTNATLNPTGNVSVLASSSEDSDEVTLRVRNTSAPTAGFPRIGFVDSGTLRGMDADGIRTDYTPSSSEVTALGPANTDVSNNGNNDVPFADSNSELEIVDTAGNRQTLDGSGNLDGTRMGVGNWDDGTGDTDPEVVYVSNSVLHSATPSDSVSLCTNRNPGGGCPGSDPGYPAQAVAGVTDFDGDSNVDIVYVDDNDELVFLDEEENTESSTGYTVDTANAVSTPADFDDDSTVEVAVVNGNGNIDLVDQNGADGTVTTSYDVRSVPMGQLDWTGDGTPDVMHVRDDNGEMARYDVVSDDTSTITDNNGNVVTPAGGPGIV